MIPQVTLDEDHGLPVRVGRAGTVPDKRLRNDTSQACGIDN
jgi:hypothetical protein